MFDSSVMVCKFVQPEMTEHAEDCMNIDLCLSASQAFYLNITKLNKVRTSEIHSTYV